MNLIFSLLILIIVIQTIIILLVLHKNRPNNKYDGQIVIGESESGGKLFSLELNGDPEEMEVNDSVIFKVVQSS